MTETLPGLSRNIFAVIKLFYVQNTMYSFKVKNNVADGHSTRKERYIGKTFWFHLDNVQSLQERPSGEKLQNLFSSLCLKMLPIQMNPSSYSKTAIIIHNTLG